MKKENKVYFYIYKNKKLLANFTVKFIQIYFLYGYLFLAGIIIFGLLFFKLFSITYGFTKYLLFLWFIPSGYCFIRFVSILLTINYKWRFYKISHYRLNTRLYSEDYFKYEIFEPCTRLIVKDILFEYGLKNEYLALKRKYLKVNQRIEDQKARILSEVMRQNTQNHLQEVSSGKKV